MAAPTGATAYLPVTMPAGTVPASMPDVVGTFAADVVIDEAAGTNWEGGASDFIDGLAAGCADLRVFSDDDAVEIAYGVKQFSQTAGSRKLILGLGIPSTYPLLASSPTPLRYYCGCTGGPFENKSGVVPTADGNAAAWMFAEGTGTTLYDWTANARNGTIAGGTWVAGINGQWALTMNGSTSGITVTVPRAAAWSYSWVARTTSLTRDTYLLFDDAGDLTQTANILHGYLDGNVELQGDLRSASAIAVPDTTNWHHYAYTYQSGTLCGYRDGVQLFSTAATGSRPRNITLLAAAVSPGIAAYSGTLHRFDILSRVLSPDWVAAYYAITSNNAAAWQVGAVTPVGGGVPPQLLRAYSVGGM